MGPLDAAVVQFTTGSVAGNGSVSMATDSSATTTHDYVLSQTPCDFTGQKQFLGRSTLNVGFSVSTGSSNLKLQPNTTYYLNISNPKVGGCVAQGTTCDLYPINLTGPR
jgi:hypothetical protein